MKIFFASLPGNLQIEVAEYFTGKRFSPCTVTRKQWSYSRPARGFDLAGLEGLLKAVPELRRRPWLFDCSDEVVEAMATYRTETDTVVLYFEFNDWDISRIEQEMPESQFADLLVLSQTVDSNHTGLFVLEDVGYGFSGEIETVEIAITTHDWVQSYGYNDEDIRPLFVPFLMKFGFDSITI